MAGRPGRQSGHPPGAPPRCCRSAVLLRGGSTRLRGGRARRLGGRARLGGFRGRSGGLGGRGGARRFGGRGRLLRALGRGGLGLGGRGLGPFRLAGRLRRGRVLGGDLFLGRAPVVVLPPVRPSFALPDRLGALAIRSCRSPAFSINACAPSRSRSVNFDIDAFLPACSRFALVPGMMCGLRRKDKTRMLTRRGPAPRFPCGRVDRRSARDLEHGSPDVTPIADRPPGPQGPRRVFL